MGKAALNSKSQKSYESQRKNKIYQFTKESEHGIHNNTRFSEAGTCYMQESSKVKKTNTFLPSH